MTQENTSLIRQNFSADVEAALNKQINIELYASYVYLGIVSFLIDFKRYFIGLNCI